MLRKRSSNNIQENIINKSQKFFQQNVTDNKEYLYSTVITWHYVLFDVSLFVDLGLASFGNDVR